MGLALLHSAACEEDRVNRMIPKLSRLGRKLCSTWIWLARLVKGDRLTVPPSRANEPLFAKREEGRFVRFPVFSLSRSFSRVYCCLVIKLPELI